MEPAAGSALFTGGPAQQEELGLGTPANAFRARRVRAEGSREQPGPRSVRHANHAPAPGRPAAPPAGAAALRSEPPARAAQQREHPRGGRAGPAGGFRAPRGVAPARRGAHGGDDEEDSGPNTERPGAAGGQGPQHARAGTRAPAGTARARCARGGEAAHPRGQRAEVRRFFPAGAHGTGRGPQEGRGLADGQLPKPTGAGAAAGLPDTPLSGPLTPPGRIFRTRAGTAEAQVGGGGRVAGGAGAGAVSAEPAAPSLRAHCTCRALCWAGNLASRLARLSQCQPRRRGR